MEISTQGTIYAMPVSTVNSIYLPNKTAETKNDSQTDNNDTTSAASATISDQGQSIISLASMFGTKPGEPITLDDIKLFADKQLKEFNSEFKALLQENNIDTSVPITLGHEQGTGDIIVTNDHPDAEKIEKLFEDNFDLRNKYTSITNALNLVKNGEEYTKFSDAYSQNPQAAVSQYSYIFNTQWQAEITFGNEEYNISYRTEQ